MLCSLACKSTAGCCALQQRSSQEPQHRCSALPLSHVDKRVEKAHLRLALQLARAVRRASQSERFHDHNPPKEPRLDLER